MPRGSSLDGSVASQQGGSGESGGGFNPVEMLGRTGSATNSGRYVIRKRFLVDSEDDLIKVPTPPTGFRATSINYTAIGGGAFEQVVEYEYFLSTTGGSQLMETQNGVSGRFELDVQDELARIESHPEIRELIRIYKGNTDYTTGKVTFPPTYTPTAASGLSGGGTGVKTNPMAGKLYYNKPSAIFRHTQQMQRIPSDIWNNVGKKVAALPAGFPNPPAFINKKGEQIKYFWIVMSPQIYRRGNAYEIVRSYKLSEPGVPDELYTLDRPDTNTA